MLRENCCWNEIHSTKNLKEKLTIITHALIHEVDSVFHYSIKSTITES